VDYTLRKYVKKPAGTPTGYVHYTHQHTLFITVQEEEIRQIALQPD
jgi:predicted ribosome quality control (RQC) complex YloA/Tae2 family protein